MSILSAGTQAPDFSLHTTPDQQVTLADFRGKNLVMAFYPADWSPVCGDQLALYNELYPMMKKLDAELLAISVDNTWCHLAYKDARKLHFHLLSDFEPKGAVAKKYGAYQKEGGTAERALFVLDKEGVIRWSYLSPIGINPGADGILDALENLKNKKEAA